MRGDSGQLPVDFLIGFTIFILCLIAVANFVPSLLVGLQRTSGIDYDAVAYRTGVVLAEDPGWPAGNPVMGEVYPNDSMAWEQETNKSVIRMGLSVNTDSPNVFSINKINRFFNSTFFPGNDYRTKLLFSSYMYGYNITLQSILPLTPGDPILLNMSIGDPHPTGYGYIRRYVLIKQNSNATINLNTTCIPNMPCTMGDTLAYTAQNDDEVTQEFRIRLDGRKLYNRSIATPYKIDLINEPFSIRITNFSFVLNRSDMNPSPVAHNSSNWSYNGCNTEKTLPVSANLTRIIYYPDCKGPDIPFYAQRIVVTVDDNEDPHGLGRQELEGAVALTRVPVYNTIQLDIDPLWPPGTPLYDSTHCLEIGLVFDDAATCDDPFGNPIPQPPHTLITGSFVYDYFNVTRPDLVPGMLEVGIW